MNTKKKQIFILAGQSNMSGRGGVTKGIGWDGIVPDPCGAHPFILRFTSNSEWVPAQEPLHFDIDTSKTCGVGPGMAFANAIIRSSDFDDVIVGLVPCAVGSTAIAEWGKGMKLYEEMVRRGREAVEGGEGGEIRAVVWFQGESDTLSEELVEVYKERMERFVGDVRGDLGLPCLPFIQVAIVSGNERLVAKLREAQLAIDLPNVVCVDAKGLPLNKDNLHLSTQAHISLGNMLAEAYIMHFSETFQNKDNC